MTNFKKRPPIVDQLAGGYPLFLKRLTYLSPLKCKNLNLLHILEDLLSHLDKK